MDERLSAILSGIREERGRIVALTGAGISAESGIPTFRGEEGIWVVGSRNYMPQEMATRAMFEERPDEVWRWYLFRFGAVRDAEPNAGHRALARLEAALGDRFTLVTQNIDGLHRRAGSVRVLAIHGEAAWVRCAAECGAGLSPLPDLGPRLGNPVLSAGDRRALTCRRCGGWLRPHVLWFDECYDEPHYRMESALRAATEADLLLVVGTSGATNLPMQIGRIAFSRGVALVDVNPDDDPFASLASRSPKGFAARGTASALLPPIVAALTG
ncbi:MAG TPA: Sir2 family NAD-dependent protein deacetylase [Anaeromyxobacteraceae bacterium]|nr:Sir2 family NAD-dependent protein deacetylase [Anaeromyxobacteraceae bacterium]